MKASGRSIAGIAAVIASALIAAAIIVLLPGRDRSSVPDDSRPATAGAGPTVSDESAAGADSDIPPDSDAPLQPLELGNLDDAPWRYRDRAEAEAARQAAIERVRRHVGSSAGGIEPIDPKVSEARPITGDGPESGGTSPAIAALPGPGEVVAGDRRIGPSLPSGGVPHAPPEAGGLRRPSAGPALPAGSAPSEDGPEITPPNPDAPGPGA